MTLTDADLDEMERGIYAVGAAEVRALVAMVRGLRAHEDEADAWYTRAVECVHWKAEAERARAEVERLREEAKALRCSFDPTRLARGNAYLMRMLLKLGEAAHAWDVARTDDGVWTDEAKAARDAFFAVADKIACWTAEHETALREGAAADSNASEQRLRADLARARDVVRGLVDATCDDDVDAHVGAVRAAVAWLAETKEKT